MMTTKRPLVERDCLACLESKLQAGGRQCQNADCDRWVCRDCWDERDGRTPLRCACGKTFANDCIVQFAEQEEEEEQEENSMPFKDVLLVMTGTVLVVMSVIALVFGGMAFSRTEEYDAMFAALGPAERSLLCVSAPFWCMRVQQMQLDLVNGTM